MSVSAYQPITAAQLQSLAAKANAKGVYVGQGSPYVFGTNATNWLTEFRRLRAQLFTYIYQRRVKETISGPWPVIKGAGGSGFNQRLTSVFGRAQPDGGPYTWTFDSLHRVWFWCASASPPTVQAIFAPGGFISVFEGNTTPPILGGTCLLKVGGTQSVHFYGTLGFQLIGGLTATITTDIPNAGASYISGSSVRIDVNGAVPPGTYSFTVNVTGATQIGPIPGMLAFYDTLALRIEKTAGTAVTAAGISGTLPVWIIDCTPVDEADTEFPFAIYMRQRDSATGQNYWIKYDSPNTSPPLYTAPVFVASVPGLWAAYTPPIATLPNVVGYMPWNPLIPSGTNRGDPLLDMAVDPPIRPNEEQYIPASGSEVSSPRNQAIVAGVYTLGGAAYHVSLNAGTTGLNEPGWNPTKGGLTQDGTVSWRNLGTVKPAQARPYCVPSWPVYKQGSGNPYASMANWGHFQNPGPGTGQRYWFIHRVRINRINPVTADTYTMEGTGALFNQIDVQIGCIRNGAFVSFGNFKTGTWAAQYPVEEQHRVMWPIFTNDALVYQASEPVDVQAEICWFPSIGYGMNQPILSDHYNDTERLLDQL